MIIKTEDFELEISTETGVYFGSKTLGQIFIKWDDLENNKKLGLENIQEKVETLILECKEILSAKEISIMKHVIIDNSGRRSDVDRRKFCFDFHIPESRSGKERRSKFNRKLKTRNLRLIKNN